MRYHEHRHTALVTVANLGVTELLQAWLRSRGLAPRLCFLWGAQVVTSGTFELRSRL